MVCRVKLQGSPEMKFQHIRSKGERTQVRRTPDWSIRNIALGSFEGVKVTMNITRNGSNINI